MVGKKIRSVLNTLARTLLLQLVDLEVGFLRAFSFTLAFYSSTHSAPHKMQESSFATVAFLSVFKLYSPSNTNRNGVEVNENAFSCTVTNVNFKWLTLVLFMMSHALM
jgi:hypothetical protein